MRYRIQNEYIVAEAVEKGAEVKSLVLKETGKELFWPGDEENWCRSSPLLFPIVGRLYEKYFTHKGKDYYLQYHGFARESFYEVKTVEKNKLVFTLTDTPERLEVYPFPFLLEVIYELPEGKREMKVTWRVHNKGDEIMYFSIGGHPGFQIPDNDLEGCKVALLDDNGNVLKNKNMVLTHLANHDGQLTGETAEVPLTNGVMAVVEEVEKVGTVVMKEAEIGGLALLDRAGNCHAKVMTKAPFWCLWREHTPGSMFMCLEPWFGMCDMTGFNGEFKDKLAIEQVPVGGIWENGYRIEIPCE